MDNSQNIKPKKKKKWYQRWWLWIIILIAAIWLINTISKTIKNISYSLTPNVTFTMQEAYGNRTENTQPLGIYDVKIIERSNGNYLVGKVKKNSSVPELSYIILDIELYDSKGNPVASEKIYSEYDFDDKGILANGDIYEFEKSIYIRDKNKTATQFKVIKLEEIGKEEVDAEYFKRILSDAEYSIKKEDFDKARKYLDEALTIDPDNDEALTLYQKLEEAEEEVKNRLTEVITKKETTTNTPEDKQSSPPSNGYYYDPDTGQWIAPFNDINDTTVNNLPDDIAEALRKYEENGYTPVTLNNLVDGVKIYTADNPDEINGHEYTVLGFGNDVGLLKDHIYVSDMLLKEDKWIPISELTEGIIEYNGSYIAYVVKLDDPAIATATKTFITTEADNYKRATKVSQAYQGVEFYRMNSDGSMGLALTVERGIRGVANTDIIVITNKPVYTGETVTFVPTRETVDAIWVLNNYYLKK